MCSIWDSIDESRDSRGWWSITDSSRDQAWNLTGVGVFSLRCLRWHDLCSRALEFFWRAKMLAEFTCHRLSARRYEMHCTRVKCRLRCQCSLNARVASASRDTYTRKFASSRCLSAQNSPVMRNVQWSFRCNLGRFMFMFTARRFESLSLSLSNARRALILNESLIFIDGRWARIIYLARCVRRNQNQHFFPHYRRFNYRERQSMRWPLCMQISQLKRFRASCRRSKGGLLTSRVLQLSSRYRSKCTSKRERERERGTLMLIVYRYAHLLGSPSEYAFRALRRRRINSAAGGLSVKPPRLLSSSRNFLLRDIHTSAAFTGN